jgi:membrane-associated protein
LSGWWVAGTVFGITLIECSLFVGFFIPAETVVILAGVICSRGAVSLWQVIPAAVLGATIGDSIGYFIGSRIGTPLLKRIIGVRWLAIQSAIEHRGASVVFFGRFSAFLRAAVPSAAGTVGLPYRRFLLWNVVGGVTWGTGITLLGYLGGESYHAILAYAGPAGGIVLGIFGVVAVILLICHRHKPRTSQSANAKDAP